MGQFPSCGFFYICNLYVLDLNNLQKVSMKVFFFPTTHCHIDLLYGLEFRWMFNHVRKINQLELTIFSCDPSLASYHMVTLSSNNVIKYNFINFYALQNGHLEYPDVKVWEQQVP